MFILAGIFAGLSFGASRLLAPQPPTPATEATPDCGVIPERERAAAQVGSCGRRNRVSPATSGLACCSLEMLATAAAHSHLSRFGMEIFRASPCQADLMIVAGRVSQKMAPVLRQVYDQMMEPKWVISMGVCASSGGMFNNYAIVQGVDQIVPVDVYAPGCPPTPQTLIHAIETLHQLIQAGEITQRRD